MGSPFRGIRDCSQKKKKITHTHTNTVSLGRFAQTDFLQECRGGQGWGSRGEVGLGERREEMGERREGMWERREGVGERWRLLGERRRAREWERKQGVGEGRRGVGERRKGVGEGRKDPLSTPLECECRTYPPPGHSDIPINVKLTPHEKEQKNFYAAHFLQASALWTIMIERQNIETSKHRVSA